MQEMITFFSNHTALTGGLIIVFVLLMIVESLRAKGAGVSLTPSDAVQKINRDHAIVIDTRAKDSFQAGHIIDAIAAPASELATANKKSEKWRAKTIIFVCQNGVESQKIASRFIKDGFIAYAISGGMSAWVNAKLPVVKE